MQESGGRRVKRSINIDMTSVHFCTPEMLAKYRNGGDGIIEVTYFYGIQCYFYHRTVRTVFRHRDPITHLQHIIGGKLDTGDKSHDTVLEN